MHGKGPRKGPTIPIRKKGRFPVEMSTTDLARMTHHIVYLYISTESASWAGLGKKITRDGFPMLFLPKALRNGASDHRLGYGSFLGFNRHGTCLRTGLAAGLPSTFETHTVTPRPFQRTQEGSFRWRRGPPEIM